MEKQQYTQGIYCVAEKFRKKRKDDWTSRNYSLQERKRTKGDVPCDGRENRGKLQVDWTENNCGLLTQCTASYHDDGAGRHTNITYGDYFLVEALAKLAGTDPMLWR